MNTAYWTYRFLTSSLFIMIFPLPYLLRFVVPEKSDSIGQRFGCYPETLPERVPGRPKIWMHASSVGEVSAAVSIIRSLLETHPEVVIIFSTSTRYGQLAAVKQLGPKAATYIYAPLDFAYPVRRALSLFRPDILVFFETEIWPNWLYEANRAGIKTLMVNGRLSVHSIKNYLKFSSLFKAVLSKMDAFSMISEEDANRICRIGAPEERVAVNGNAKYDHLIQQMESNDAERIKRLFDFKNHENVFVAGSTRTEEEEIVLDAYQEIRASFPLLNLVIAPRHVERAYAVEAIARRRGIACQLRTDLDGRKGSRTSSIVIMDTIGELMDVYSLATVVFCGGSLVPKGGHNMLEAAIWGKPVLFGPSIEDFADAGNLLLKAGGGIQVKDGHEMAGAIVDLLKHPEKAERMGADARDAVLSKMGASAKHARVISGVLKSIDK